MILLELVQDFILNEKYFKCTKGIKRGKIVTSPSLCAIHTRKTVNGIIRQYRSNNKMIGKHGWYYTK